LPIGYIGLGGFLAKKTHGTGTRARHKRKERSDLFGRLEKKRQQRLNQLLRRQRGKNARLAGIVKNITAPEILKQWARYQRLLARKQLKSRAIRQFTFYCRLLAIDALCLKHLPKEPIRIQKGVIFRPPKEGILSKARKKDIFERLEEMKTNTLERKKRVNAEIEELQKTLPTTIRK